MQLRALKPQWGGITFEVVFYYFFRISIITTITGSFFIVTLNYVVKYFLVYQNPGGTPENNLTLGLLKSAPT